MYVSFSAVPRGIALLRWVLVLALVLAASVAVAPRDAGAQGTGFTGDIYYANGVYGPMSALQWAPEWHSYGFNSAKNTSQTARGQVLTVIDDDWNDGWKAAAWCNDLCRVCVHGTYPNCTDTDGYSWRVAVANNSTTTNLRIQGHGAY